MKVLVRIVSYNYLEDIINNIGYENILNILVDPGYSSSNFIIIFKQKED